MDKSHLAHHARLLSKLSRFWGEQHEDTLCIPRSLPPQNEIGCASRETPGVLRTLDTCRKHEDLAAASVPHLSIVVYAADAVMANVYSQCSATSSLLLNRRDLWLQSSGKNIHPHFRIVQKLAVPVVYARNSREYTQAMCDVLETIIEANEKARFLHEDISLNNIMIDLETSSGILNDWDHSGPSPLVAEPKERRQRAAFCTGTWQFMSIELLGDPYKIHDVDDDVQSLFWAFLMGGLRHFKHNQDTFRMRLFDDADSVNIKGRTVWVGGQLKRAFIGNSREIKALIFECQQLQAIYLNIANRYRLAYVQAELAENTQAQQSVEQGEGNLVMPSPHALLKIFQDALNLSWPLNALCSNKFASQTYADIDRKLRQTIHNSRCSNSRNVARPSRDTFHDISDSSSSGMLISDPGTWNSDSPAQGSSLKLLFLSHRPSQETDATSPPFGVFYFEDILSRSGSEVLGSAGEDGEAGVVIANVYSQCSATASLLFNRRNSCLQSSASDTQPRAVHLRIVQKLAVPVVYARNSREYTQVMCDVLETIIEAHEKARILHRDVSLNNIMIDLETDSGILNDWDHSGPSPSDAERGERPEERRQRAASCTGTWQFMSIELLNDPYKTHSVDDDVQSLYWAFLLGGLRHLGHNRRRGCLDMFDEARQVCTEHGPVMWEGGWLKQAFLTSSKNFKALIFECQQVQAIHSKIAWNHARAYARISLQSEDGSQQSECKAFVPGDLLQIFQSVLKTPSFWPLNDMGPNKFAPQTQVDTDRKMRQTIQNGRGDAPGSGAAA